MEKQFTHEELQRDEVADGVHKAMEGMQRHRHWLIGALVLLVAAIIGSAAWKSSRQAKTEEASNLMIEIINRYQAFEQQSVPEDRTRSFDETNGAINALQTEFPNTKLSNLAEYIKGKLAFNNNEFDKAAESFGKFLADAKTADEKAIGEIALGYNDENAAFLDTDDAKRKPRIASAMTHYNNAVKAVSEGHYLAYYARLGVARLHEASGENQQALDLLKDLVAHQPLAGPETKPADVKKTDDTMGDALRTALLEYKDTVRLGATAELRLKRLEARMGVTEQVETTTAVQDATKPEAAK